MGHRVVVRTLLLAAAVVALVAGATRAAPDGAAQAPPVEALRVEVVRSTPHDPRAFTQGLLWDGKVLVESTGLYGRSSLRTVERETGRVIRLRTLPPSVFGEGLAQVGSRLVQLTWRNRIAYVWGRSMLKQRGTFRYATEGWGLCYDGRQLVHSDGTPVLAFRDPVTFKLVRRVTVTVDAPAVSLAGLPPGPVRMLNELECVGGSVYANVWQTDLIVRIDPASGRVTAVIDAAGLLTPTERAAADVLNGIAYDRASGVFLVTGKLWPRLFEVRFVPRSS